MYSKPLSPSWWRQDATTQSEVLREGVRLVQEREARLAALDATIERGIADADAGRVKPAGEVFDRLEAKYRAQAERKGQ